MEDDSPFKTSWYMGMPLMTSPLVPKDKVFMMSTPSGDKALWPEKIDFKREYADIDYETFREEYTTDFDPRDEIIKRTAEEMVRRKEMEIMKSFAGTMTSTAKAAEDATLTYDKLREMMKLIDDEVKETTGITVSEELRDEDESEVDVAYLPEIVKIAKAFQDLSFKGAFEVEMPMSVAAWVTEKKAYRRRPIEQGVSLVPEGVKVGKQAGLIFVLKPDLRLVMSTVEYEFVELNWRELMDGMPSLFQAVCHDVLGHSTIDSTTVGHFDALNKEMTASFSSNPAMLKVAQNGLKRALERRAEIIAATPEDEQNALYGMF